jgi:integrase
VKLISKSFSDTYGQRNKALFLLGVRSGFRISEMLSLRVGDLHQHGKIIDRVTVQRRHMKGGKAGKTSSRTVLLHHQAREALDAWLQAMATRTGGRSPDLYVFKSRTGGNRPISRVQAWRILQQAFAANGLTGKLGTHCMRKTFANKVYEQLDGRLEKVQKALGHANINSTIQYLSFREEDIDAAILAA